MSPVLVTSNQAMSCLRMAEQQQLYCYNNNNNNNDWLGSECLNNNNNKNNNNKNNQIIQIKIELYTHRVGPPNYCSKMRTNYSQHTSTYYVAPNFCPLQTIVPAMSISRIRIWVRAMVMVKNQPLPDENIRKQATVDKTNILTSLRYLILINWRLQ